MAITDLNRCFPACIISSSFRINALFVWMLLLDVSVIISSGITSLWVSVCKTTTAFSPHGHKEFTWWYGTLVGYTDIIDIYQPNGRTNGRHYDSLGMHLIMPMCPGMNLDLRIAFYNPSSHVGCCRTPHDVRCILTGWALPLWKWKIGDGSTNISHSSHQRM